MQFDHKELPPELLFKLDQAKNEERMMTESSDATRPEPTPINPDHSPVNEVVVEMMAHWASDDADVKKALTDVDHQQLKEKNQDLEDKASIKTGFAGDFVPDSAGPAADVGMPETKPVGGKALGGGGGGDGGGDDGAGGPFGPDDLGGGGSAGGDDGGDDDQPTYGGDGDGSGDESGEEDDKPFPDDDNNKNKKDKGSGGSGRK